MLIICGDNTGWMVSTPGIHLHTPFGPIFFIIGPVRLLRRTHVIVDQFIQPTVCFRPVYKDSQRERLPLG
ncbi:hypothetical protein PSYPI_35335, partial [Pseudomonas syringae pv. pisi str. 1704B]